MRAISRVLAILAVAAVAPAAAPNFSGHWKLNAEKSKLDDPYVGMTEERTVDHQDPNLEVSIKAVIDGDNEESTAKYTTDGKETRNLVDGDPMFSTVRWSGNALLFESQIISDTDTTELHDRWSLSEDGKTLTIERKQKVGFDVREFVFVYDRA